MMLSIRSCRWLCVPLLVATVALCSTLLCSTLLCSTLLAVAGPSANAADADLARQILAATGVQGGLILHLGCGDGKLTAALRAGDSYLVHGLDADAANVASARAHLQQSELGGKVTFDQWAGGPLPYVDNLVNLLVSEQPQSVAAEEILRVLTPGGVAYLKKDGHWTKTVKPRPTEIDDWTHYLHDPSNNAVAHDTVVGSPRHYQWIGSPPLVAASRHDVEH